MVNAALAIGAIELARGHTQAREYAELTWIPDVLIVGAFVVAAVVTPPDVVSQLMLAVPMCLLYELGIFLSRFVTKTRADEAVSS